MSHMRSHNVRHNVTDGGRDAFRTIGVTLLQTRPDQSLCYVGLSSVVASLIKLKSPTREGIEIDG